MEAAQGLLTLPAAGIATGTKMASQAVDLADEVLAVAMANRLSLTALVRSEVEVAISALGLVPVQKLEEVQAEAARLRAENAQLRSASSRAAAPKAAAKKAAPRSTARTAKTAGKASAPRSAVTTRATPAGT
jgi:septal ring factor EnvC (AmiA/AmiB activator)